MLRISLCFLIALFLVSGCDKGDDNPVAPGQTAYNIIFSNLPDSLTAPEGAIRSLQFEVVVADRMGNAVPGVTVDLSVPGSSATVTPMSAVTDNAGVVAAELNLTFHAGRSIVHVHANTGESTTAQSIVLIGSRQPAAISLNSDTPSITVPDGLSGVIRFTAVVTDSHSVGIANIRVRFNLAAVQEGGEVFGSLTVDEFTDNSGTANATLNSGRGFGRIIVRCVVDEGEEYAYVANEIEVEVVMLESSVASLVLIANPESLVVPPELQDTAVIHVQALDVNNVGISNLRLNFRTSIGRIEGEAVTDENGAASVTFSNVHKYGLAIITCEIPASDIAESIHIEVTGELIGTGSLLLGIDRDTIYADRGVSIANLTAIVKDHDREPVVAGIVSFRSDYGTIISEVLTDTVGIARAVFTDYGIPSFDPNGDLTAASIVAEYSPFDVADTVYCAIKPNERVDRVVLIAGTRDMFVGSTDSIWVVASCMLANGDPVNDGIQVHFTVEEMMGTISPETAITSGGAGDAMSYFTPGPSVGPAVLTASVVNIDSSIETSNSWVITLFPGPPYAMAIGADPIELIVNDLDAYSTITVIVVDSTWNPVRPRTQVMFTTTLGDVSPSTAYTDSFGHTITRLTPDLIAGVAEITADVPSAPNGLSRTTTVRFRSGVGSSIELSANPIQIHPAGGGRNSSTTLRALLVDANGNLVETPTPVVFELVNEPPEPVGCNINNRGQRDTVLTAHGDARATLNAGTQTGPKLIHVYTIDQAGNPTGVEATLSAVIVVSGDPAQIEITYDSRADDAGGGAWALEVSALVSDRYFNAVADSIPVAFTIGGDNPEIASIGHGFTGNQNRFGRPREGVAFTELTYSGVNTFDTISVVAWVRSAEEDSIGSTIEFPLPLQRGRLSLSINPENWMFITDEPHDSLEVRTWATLRDGHDNHINNAPILFTTWRGNFFYVSRVIGEERTFRIFRPDPARRHTGPGNDGDGAVEIDFDDDPNGQAVVWLRGSMFDFFLDPFTVEMTFRVEASVEGFEGIFSAPVYVTVNRRPPEE